jgi:hypothetical protein
MTLYQLSTSEKPSLPEICREFGIVEGKILDLDVREIEGKW